MNVTGQVRSGQVRGFPIKFNPKIVSLEQNTKQCDVGQSAGFSVKISI